MKKITLVLIIAALSIFMSASVVLAHGNRYRNFKGTYEMSLKGNGLNSTCGFSSFVTDFGTFYKPNDDSDCVVWGSTDTAYGTFIFNRDGTGSAEGRNYAFDLPPGNGGIGLARTNPFYIEFDYEITPEGEIKVDITFPPILTSVEMIGRVSKNRKTMTLTNSNSPLEFGTHSSLFTATRVLIQVLNNVEDED